MDHTQDSERTDKAQANLVKQLEELNKWQQEQQKLLEERQNIERHILGYEQIEFYKGLRFFEDNESVGNVDRSPIEVGQGDADTDGNDDFYEINFKKNQQDPKVDSGISTYDEITNENAERINKPTEPRPFLKRGEGLKQRFKIDPESLRLNNLPRYKYSSKASSTSSKIKLNKGKSSDRKLKSILCPTGIHEKQFHTSTPDLKSQNSPKILKLPKVRFSRLSPEVPQLRQTSSNLSSEGVNLDLDPRMTWAEVLDPTKVKPIPIEEIRANKRNSLDFSRLDDDENLSIFEMLEEKAKNSSIYLESYSLKKFMEQKLYDKLFKEESDNDIINVPKHIQEAGLEPGVKNLPREKMVSSTDDDDDDSDNNSNDKVKLAPSIPLTDVNVRFQNRDTNQVDLSETSSISETIKDNTDLFQHFKDALFMALQLRAENELNNNTSEPSQTEIPQNISGNSHRNVENRHPCSDIRTQNEASVTTFKQSPTQQSGSSVTVFSQPSIIHPSYEKPCSSTSASKLNVSNAKSFKSCGEKKKLSSSTATNLSTLPPSSTLELEEKTQLAKKRLNELEHEISVFKSNNHELIKAKQQHELIVAQFNQEQEEAKERLRDYEIQIEMYLHDERMKIENERQKFEQQMRMQKSSLISKDRQELARLKQELEETVNQLKLKEQQHSAAQSRLRGQIGKLEREQKRLYDEIENLQRENKKIQNDNLRKSREESTKMLAEINRNIAKLAPKLNCQQSSPPPPLPDHKLDDTNSSRMYSKSDYSLHAAKSNKKTIPTKTHTKHAAPISPRMSSIKDQKAILKTSKKPVISTPLSSPPSQKKSVSINLGTECINGNDDSDEDDDDYYDDAYDNDVDVEIAQQLQAQMAAAKKLNYDQLHINKSRTVATETAPAASTANNSNSTKKQSVEALKTDIEKESKCIAQTATTTPQNNENNFKREIINADGSKDVWYPNGNIKKISSDGMKIRMLYFNKDIKETNINDGTVKYYWAESNTWHTTYLDGMEILEFPNGQTEHRFKDGRIEVHYPNNSVKFLNPADEHKQEEWRLPDGTCIWHMRNGDKVFLYANGQKEIHTSANKRREYPDGTVKIVYPDGSQETCYSNGRIRLKDKDGNLILDSELAKLHQK